MDYKAMIDEYLDTQRPDISQKTRSDYKRAIIAGVDFMTNHGYYNPKEEFYKELKAHLLKDNQPGTVTKKLLPPIRQFFKWAAKKGDPTMIEAQTTTQTQPPIQAKPKPEIDEISTEIEAAPAIPAPSNVDNNTRKKPGRKMLGDEPRTEKISIYLTPSLLSDAQDLARIDGQRFADYIFKLIQLDADTRRNKLDTLRQLRG